MASDLQMSELISKSLRYPVDAEESRQLEKHLLNSLPARKFNTIAKAIQESVSIAGQRAVQGDPSVAPGLSTDAKERLRKSVSMAVREKLSLSQAGLIDSQVDQTLVPEEKSAANDTRKMSSRYRLLRRIGEGGLGTVWLARDEKLKRNVALKELKQDALQSPRSWQRFHREAEITGQLEHPNVVPLYQFGEDSRTGEPFYAMRFVGKRTLADAIVEHRDRVEAGEGCALGMHRLLTAFLGVCQAIAYAHSRGVIHRDLKPENVALDNFGQVIVLDWGLAKLRDEGEVSNQVTCETQLSDSAMRQTMEGDVIGTPLFMAPEQAAGDLDNIDERTDVFGLGAILFAILTGKAPHEDSIAQLGSSRLASILTLIAGSESSDHREFPTCVPSGLTAICRKAMARKRHLRFETVDELSEAVERWMAGHREQKARYDGLRLEGRELRAGLQSLVNDVERNVRFMSRLPPIQQLIQAASGDDVATWRERLATIFHGLLEANSNYRNVVYCAATDGGLRELVRVERHGDEVSRIRVVPKSRLRTVDTNCYSQALLAQKPDEVITSLVGDPMCEARPELSTDSGKVGLVSGVPIYDEETEEVFGVVLIDTDIQRHLTRQLTQTSAASELIIACDTFHTINHSRDRTMIDESRGKPIADVAPHFEPVMEALQTQLEYIDDNNKELYGGRLWLIPNRHGLVYLLR